MLLLLVLNMYFNPRSHEGSDNSGGVTYTKNLGISIHAPTRGATETAHFFSLGKYYFNPRSHEGSDKYTYIYC